MRAWSPSLDRYLDPTTGGDGLVLLGPRVQAGRVFLGYPAGHIGWQIAAESVRLVYDLAP